MKCTIKWMFEWRVVKCRELSRGWQGPGSKKSDFSTRPQKKTGGKIPSEKFSHSRLSMRKTRKSVWSEKGDQKWPEKKEREGLSRLRRGHCVVGSILRLIFSPNFLPQESRPIAPRMNFSFFGCPMKHAKSARANDRLSYNSLELLP